MFLIKESKQTKRSSNKKNFFLSTIREEENRAKKIEQLDELHSFLTKFIDQMEYSDYYNNFEVLVKIEYFFNKLTFPCAFEEFDENVFYHLIQYGKELCTPELCNKVKECIGNLPSCLKFNPMQFIKLEKYCRMVLLQ